MRIVTKLSSFLTVMLALLGLTLMQCRSQNTESLSQFQIDSLTTHYQAKLNSVLLKDKSLASHLKIDSVGISIFPTDSREAEFVLSWQELPIYQTFLEKRPLLTMQLYPQKPTENILRADSSDRNTTTAQANEALPLQGLRIALDPGHFAEDFKTALMEGKYVQMNLTDGTKIKFFESELAWYTSRILADELERLGAEVLMSRDDYKYTAFNESYMDWYQRFIKVQKDSGNAAANLTPQQAFFKHFRKMEFEKRADKINQFRPDLSLVIHYNVDATNTKWNKPTPRNNSMTFAGGSYMKGELDKPEARFHLLRFLISQDLENSVALGKALLTSLEDSLGIRPIGEPNKQFFLKDYCLPSTAKGVYHRNLTLARKLLGTMTYLEPLYQDNIQEVKKLQTRDFEYKGRKIPRRVYEVAQAYKAGILKYLAPE